MTRPNRPRRKAKQSRAQETVEVVLEAAARVLLDRGYGAASTNRIAETAGVSVGTVYEYFANKEEVYEALAQREISAVTTAIRGQTLRPDDPVDAQLAQLVVAAMRALRFGPGFFRALEQAPNSSFRAHLAEARQDVINLVTEVLEPHRSVLRVKDLDLAAFVVVSALEGVGTNASDESFDERLAEELASLIRAYLIGGD